MATLEERFKDRIVVLDFGSQYTWNIAKRIRKDCRVYSEVVPCDISLEKLLMMKPKGIVLSGGPDSVTKESHYACDNGIFELNIPILGICYGLQLMAKHFGGNVAKAERREYGHAELVLTEEGLADSLFYVLPKKSDVWMSHGDLVENIPGFVALGTTHGSPFAASRHRTKPMYGVQFHPEVYHTPRGGDILRKFAVEICGCRQEWSMEHFIESAVQEIREKVGDGHIIGGISGGVDSSVAAILAQKAVGDRAIFLFVDNGLLRKNEAEEVMEAFRKMDMNVRLVDAQEIFLSRLEGIADPEQKRKIIGDTFIEIFYGEAEKYNMVPDKTFLLQGTLYTDRIESGSGVGKMADTIKSHHNVNCRMVREKQEKGLVIEPNRMLFKDDVREVGALLPELPEYIRNRWPFPGPGNAIRIKGEVTREKLRLLNEADYILKEEVQKAGLYSQIWQGFCVLLSDRTVGVMGDERTYDCPVVVRLITSVDGMTAKAYRLPHDVQDRVTSRIVNEVKGINRVVYDDTSKPPGTIEWE